MKTKEEISRTIILILFAMLFVILGVLVAMNFILQDEVHDINEQLQETESCETEPETETDILESETEATLSPLEELNHKRALAIANFNSWRTSVLQLGTVDDWTPDALAHGKSLLETANQLIDQYNRQAGTNYTHLSEPDWTYYAYSYSRKAK